MRFAPLSPGRLERRYKRFLADVTLETGETITAHCPNPGSMMGVAPARARAWVSRSDNPKRKLAHTLELVEVDGALVAINTHNPNRLAEEAVQDGRIEPLAGYARLRREVRYGAASRIDLLLEDGARPACFVEVKNVHLRRTGRLAEFPDSVTARGAKHLRELAQVARRGDRAVMLFIVQRGDCDALSLAADLDPAYAEAFVEARAAGVEALVYGCAISTTEVEVERRLELIEHGTLGT